MVATQAEIDAMITELRESIHVYDSSEIHHGELIALMAVLSDALDENGRPRERDLLRHMGAWADLATGHLVADLAYDPHTVSPTLLIMTRQEELAREWLEDIPACGVSRDVFRWALENSSDRTNGFVSALGEIVEHGLGGGSVGHLVYYSDIREFFNKHENDIEKALDDAIIDRQGLWEQWDCHDINAAINASVWAAWEIRARDLLDYIEEGLRQGKGDE